MLVTTVGVSFAVQMLLIYVPFLQGIFQTTSLGLSDLMLLLFIAGIAAGLHSMRRNLELRWRKEGKGGVEDDDDDEEGGGAGGGSGVGGWIGRLA